MDKLKMAIFISGNGSNLQSLIDETKKVNCPYEISCVVSNNSDAYGLKRALSNNISTIIVNHKKFKKREDFDSAIDNEIKSFNVELIVLAGFMRILSKNFVNKYKNKIINLHPSLLPKYPGLNTYAKALENKDLYHGATVHIVDDGLDTGMILGFSKFKIEDNDNHDSLLAKTHEIENKLLPSICSLIAEGKVNYSTGALLIEKKLYKNGKEFTY